MNPLLRLQSLSFSLLFGLLLASCQPHHEAEQALVKPNNSFLPLLKHLRKPLYSAPLGTPPVLYRDSSNIYSDERHYKRVLGYELRLAPQPLGLRCRTVQLRNPFGTDTFPIANSIIYQRHLVALFSPGRFACFCLPALERDTQLEERLNGQLFDRHQTFNEQLVGWRQGRAFRFDSTQKSWQPCPDTLPFNQWPKLFEDGRYVCTKDCQGEFGGNLYFFDKQTQHVTRTDATCATAVWKQDGQYQVLASLAHMLGSARRGTVQAPELLPPAATLRNPMKTWEYDLPDMLPDLTVRRVFGFSGVLMPGAFRWRNQTFYLVDWRNATFVATVNGKQITIVDPLFSNSLGTHHAVTTTYLDGAALTTIPRFYANGREAACLLLQNGTAQQVEWSTRIPLSYE